MQRSDRIGMLLFSLGIVLLAFMAGIFVALTERWPYRHFHDAWNAARALSAQSAATDLYTQTHLWRETRRSERGVTIRRPELMQKGYTLYTSGDGSYANLIDADGNILHRWSLPYENIWDQSPAGRAPRPADRIYWDKVRLFPNGDLAVVITADNDTPWGYGLIRLDKDSRLIWRYHVHAHHDLDILPNGDIVVLTHEFVDEPIPGFHGLQRPWLNDFVVIVAGTDGRELARISLADAFLETPFFEVLYLAPGYALGDPLHANSVQYIDESLAAAFAPAQGKSHQVLVSFRHPSAIALIDLDTGKVSWTRRSDWLVQHDARALLNGNFTLFDNVANYHEMNRSRVLELNPLTHAIVWSYTGNDEHPFDSGVRSSAETLPNGNRLVTESDGGRLFEVTPAGEIAWEFINPIRGGSGDHYIPVISAGQRIFPEFLDEAFRRQLAPQRR